MKRGAGALVVVALAGALRGGETAPARGAVTALVPPPGRGPAVALLSAMGPDGRPVGPASLAAFVEREGGGPPLMPDGALEGARPAWATTLSGAARTRPALIGPPNNLVFFLDGTRGYPSFARRLQDRRRVLVLGEAGGSMRGFDAGFAGERGTGARIFTFVPDGVRAAAAPRGLEPPPTFDDVYVDANWAGGGRACPEELGAGGRNCQWRTVLAGGLGASGRTVWALDVTAPDSKRSAAGASADCVARSGPPAPGCSGVYPTKLWELSDPSLGFTHSAPRFGRVRVRNSATGRPEERSVVIFGGGWDAADTMKVSGRSVHASRVGNELFMLDVATGAVLFRTDRGFTRSPSGREVSRPFGSIPSPVTALDLDEDGFTDTVWFGDVNGGLWKLTLPAEDARLALRGPDGVRDSGKDAGWRAVLVFDASMGAAGHSACAAAAASGALAGCPEENAFARPPAVVNMGLDPASGQPVFGVAAVTGNALDLSARSDRGGRVVFLPDRPASAGAPLAPPRTPDDLVHLTASGGTEGRCAPDGATRTGGWTLDLPPGERVDSDLLAIAYQLHFTAKTEGSGGPSRYGFYSLRIEDGAPCRGRPLDVTFASEPAAWTDAHGRVKVTVAGEAGGRTRLFEAAVPVRTSLVNWGP